MGFADFYLAFCLILLIEGLAYGLFPAQMKKIMAQVFTLPDRHLQNFGLAMAALGLLLAYLAR